MFERYTERARRVFFFARYEASQFGSKTIETEHLLLGLCREDRILIQRFLQAAQPEDLRNDVARLIAMREKVSTSADLPLSNECKRILAYAAEESERLLHKSIGTEHILLGILREEKSTAAQILSDRGIKVDVVREELARNPISPEQPAPTFGLPGGTLFSRFFQNPELPKTGVVPDADTAKRIAEAILSPVYGAEMVAGQAPLQAELKHNMWIVTGSSPLETALFVFMFQTDGRIVSMGRGPAKP